MKIVERIPAHYESQEVEDLGRIYRWCPEQVMLECDACGTTTIHKRSDLLTSIVACGECGARSTASVREELLVDLTIEDEIAHPWRYWTSREDAGLPV